MNLKRSKLINKCKLGLTEQPALNQNSFICPPTGKCTLIQQQKYWADKVKIIDLHIENVKYAHAIYNIKKTHNK